MVDAPVECIRPGTVVQIGLPGQQDITAIVNAVFITGTDTAESINIQYEVVYWDGRDRKTILIDQYEVRDDLPIGKYFEIHF